MSARREMGIITAPPMPCTTRAATSMGREVDSAHSSEPRANTATEAR